MIDFDKQEHSANDPLPHVFAHQRRILVEKATNELLKAEEKEPLCDRIAQNMADVEA